MDRYKAHQTLVKKFKLEVQNHFKGIRVFDRHVGLMYTRNGTPVMINKKGMADAYALLPTKYGMIHIELEFKTGKAVQTKEQKLWQGYINRNEGLCLVVHENMDFAIERIKNYLIIRGIKWQ